MAFGVSGAIQHLAGMNNLKVHKDADAPIFHVAIRTPLSLSTLTSKHKHALKGGNSL
ncbi:hypothetical protein SLEP1_g26451 [Rubroshorea leprosula]|uniref:Uncharacterized protein n=1 Tax=Rubroshorea leprosula TaxID=152421 RepID=A0AAV5JXS1_9ROSI|nr:hypothetical protein SLEP1_g26451 [Rubroshorea leprosula]